MSKRKMEYGPFEPMRGAWGQATAIQLESSVADDRNNTPWANGTSARRAERNAAARRPAGALKPGQLNRARRLRLQGAAAGMTPASPDML